MHASVELPRVDDLAAFDTDGELCYLHYPGCRSNGNLGDTHPVRVGAHDNAYAAARDRIFSSFARARMGRGPRLPSCCFCRSIEKLDQPFVRRMLNSKLDGVCVCRRGRLIDQRLQGKVLLPLAGSAHDQTAQSSETGNRRPHSAWRRPAPACSQSCRTAIPSPGIHQAWWSRRASLRAWRRQDARPSYAANGTHYVSQSGGRLHRVHP